MDNSISQFNMLRTIAGGQSDVSLGNYKAGVGKTFINSFSWNESNSTLTPSVNPGKNSSNRRFDYISDEKQKTALSVKQSILERAKATFVEIARQEYFESGYAPPSERFVQDFAKEHPTILADLIQGVLLEEAQSATVMVALLNAVSSMRYEDVRPYGQTTALAAVTNPSVEVKEAAIRAYEAWGHPEGAKILAFVDCPWPWLDDYRKQVIEDLGAE